jgi:hypothetical protein
MNQRIKRIIVLLFCSLVTSIVVWWFFLPSIKSSLPLDNPITWLVSGDQYIFADSGGEKPDHIKTEVNTTLETFLSEHPNLPWSKCTENVANVNSNASLIVPAICLKGHGAKVIMPIPHDTPGSNSIFYSPQDTGFLVEQHLASDWPRQFFDRQWRSDVPYFVVPFDGYEIPTYHPAETNTYLPMWKLAFQKFNSMSSDYFDSHIVVLGTFVTRYSLDNRWEKRFSVVYYYQIDWTRIHLMDSFSISREGIGDEITLDEFLHDAMVNPYETKFKQMISIQKLKLVDRLATKEQIREAVRKASPVLKFDANIHTRVDRDGRLSFDLYGVVDWAANKCLSSRVMLEDASVSDVAESYCFLIH